MKPYSSPPRRHCWTPGLPWPRKGLDAGQVIALTGDAENIAVLGAAVGDRTAVRGMPQ